MRHLSTFTALFAVTLGAASAQKPNEILTAEIRADRHVVFTNRGKQPIRGYAYRFLPYTLSPESLNYSGNDCINAKALAPGETEDYLELYKEAQVERVEVVMVIFDDGTVIATIDQGDPGMVEARIASHFQHRAEAERQWKRFRELLGPTVAHESITAAAQVLEDARDHVTSFMELLLLQEDGEAKARQWLDDKIALVEHKRKDVMQ